MIIRDIRQRIFVQFYNTSLVQYTLGGACELCLYLFRFCYAGDRYFKFHRGQTYSKVLFLQFLFLSCAHFDTINRGKISDLSVMLTSGIRFKNNIFIKTNVYYKSSTQNKLYA